MSGALPILIADDNDHDVLFLLQGFADINVKVSPTCVGDGDSCVEMLSSHHGFRLAVIDLYLPKKTGVEVLEMLTAREPGSAPIVILTSHVSEAQRRRLEEAGVHAIVEKPADLAGFASLASYLVTLMSD
jgi:CheY-like chemotaxis protein